MEKNNKTFLHIRMVEIKRFEISKFWHITPQHSKLKENTLDICFVWGKSKFYDHRNHRD